LPIFYGKVSGGEQNDGYIGGVRLAPEILYQLKARHEGHLEVCNDDVRLFIRSQIECLCAVFTGDYVKAVVAKFYGDNLNDVNLIVDNQYF